MADITDIFGGDFTPPIEKIIDPPEIQLKDAMIDHGITPPDIIYMDGQIHRFNSGTKGRSGYGDKTGWYVAYDGQVPAGTFGCWRLGVEINFKANIGRQLTAVEEMAHTKRIAEAKALRDAELAKTRELAANTVNQIWENGTHATDDHGYLIKKNVKSHGARVTGDGRLMFPLFDIDGNISSLQYVDVNSNKQFHTGGATRGMFWSLGDDISTIYIAEGFATAASIYEATNKKTIITYSASNLVPVTEIIREKYPHTDICIVADNDKNGIGLNYATQASAKYGVRVVMPPEQGDANDYVMAGHDLLALLNPPKDDWLIQADDFSRQPAPIKWLVKGWLQDQALIMVHGPSGGGKTFVVLDWCMHIAAGKQAWGNHRVRHGNIIYLAGEGHHGLKSRIAAWKQYYQVEHLNMWLSKDGCDLNTPEGYQRVTDNLRTLPKKPSIIVVDTLHRFLLGDENSAQDAKTMLDACNALMNEFECSVLLVHHTGVSEDAQHRARGSSAWRGALDIEVSIVPSTEESPMKIIQRKSKDAELSMPMHVNLYPVKINGWFDEDGEPVSSAIINHVEFEEKLSLKDEKIVKICKDFEMAWESSGSEFRDGMPFLSRSALSNYLENKGMKEHSIDKYLKPGNDKFIGALLDLELIRIVNHGWEICDFSWSNSLILLANN